MTIEITMWNAAKSLRRVAVVCGVAAMCSNASLAQNVVIAIDPGLAESNLYWETIGGLIPPNMQTLVGNDPVTGAYDVSALAESWSHNKEFTSWTFKLKRNARFSGNWGAITAKDVVHSFEQHTGKNSRLSGVQALRAAKVFAVDDQTVRFDLPAPDPDFLFLHAGRAVLVIYSKAQFDAEGLSGYAAKPAGSGPFEFVSRDLGNTLKYKTVQNHWSGVKVNYDTLEFRFVGEPATRMAMQVAEEAHISSLPRELQRDVVAKGHKVIKSSQAAMQSAIMFSGLFMDPNGPAAKMNLPWKDVRIREAMNRAVDRKAIFDVLYDSRAEPLVVFSMDRRFEGYSAGLAARFDKAYGYDLARARDLLKQANYPQAFPNPVITIAATSLAGSPEFGLMAELLQAQFAKIGLQTQIREMDWPTLQNARTSFKADFIHPMRNAPIRPNAIGVLASHAKQLSPAYSAGSSALDAMGDELVKAQDPAARATLVSNMFTHVFDNYAHIPLARVSAEVVINPKRIASWQFPGASSSGLSHFHLISAVK